MRERRARGDPVVHGEKDLSLKSSSLGIEVSTHKLEPGRGSGFFERKCPFWRRRRRNREATSSQEEGASNSRLCVEAAHESPIPAVRKPAQRDDLLGRDPSQGSPGAKPASSLLRKLLCLNDANSSSRPKKPSQGPGVPLICGGNVRCGPVAALSRTADPQGESPLRWKPRSETQSAVEVASSDKMETTGTTNKAEASWITKPWRTFRAAIASRVHQRSNLTGIEKATEDGEPDVPTEPEASSDTKVDAEPSRNMEPKLPEASPDHAHSLLESKASQRVSWHGLEIHRTAEEDMAEPAAEAKERKSTSLEGSLWEENPVLRNMSEWESLQKQVYNLLGGNGEEVQETAPEDEDLEGGGCGYWVDEEQDLGDLAENPGGQGMLMATRDLGWLSSELFGNPSPWKTEEKAESDGKAVVVDVGEGGGRRKTTPGQVTAATHTDDSLLLPSGSDTVTSHRDTSRPHVAEGEATWSPKKWEPLTFPESSPISFPTRALEKGLLLSDTFDSEERDAQQGQAGAARKLPASNKEATGFATWHNANAVGPGDAQEKRLIYLTATEIVGAAIDAAAGQLAKEEEEEEGQAETELNTPIP